MQKLIRLMLPAFAVAGFLACRTTAGSNDSSMDGSTDGGTNDVATTGDASDATAGQCTITSNVCQPMSDCCPFQGHRILIEANCAEKALTVMYCKYQVGADCDYQGQIGCFYALEDAGPDAGRIVFTTPSTWEKVPGYEPCSGDDRAKFTALPKCP